MKESQLNIDGYINALEQMKNSSRDRIGILGDLGATSVGGMAGAGLAGTTASAAGVTTLFGSSTLASILGGIFVTTTPVGWVLGSIVVGGAVGCGIGKLVRSGGQNDVVRKMNMRELERRIREQKIRAQNITGHEEKMRKMIEGLQLLVRNQVITQEDATGLLAGIEKGSITVNFAFKTIQEMIGTVT